MVEGKEKEAKSRAEVIESESREGEGRRRGSGSSSDLCRCHCYCLRSLCWRTKARMSVSPTAIQLLALKSPSHHSQKCP